MEKRDLYKDQRRPDIVIPEFQVTKDLHLEFSAHIHVSHPMWCQPPDLLGKLHLSAKVRSDGSMKWIVRGSLSPSFSSILGGGVQLQSKCWLVARRAQENVPDILAKDFVSFWMGALSCELQHAVITDYGKQYAGPPQSMAQHSNSYFGKLQCSRARE